MADSLPFRDPQNNMARAADLMSQLARETEELIAKEREERRVYG